MKKILLITLLIGATFGLASCGNSEGPLTEAEQAEKYNMTITEYKEMKDAAARMNMTIEEHMKMTDMSGEDHSNMDMGDDSHMIEDDMEEEPMMSDDAMHMEMMHAGEDIESHGSDEHGSH